MHRQETHKKLPETYWSKVDLCVLQYLLCCAWLLVIRRFSCVCVCVGRRTRRSYLRCFGPRWTYASWPSTKRPVALWASTTAPMRGVRCGKWTPSNATQAVAGLPAFSVCVTCLLSVTTCLLWLYTDQLPMTETDDCAFTRVWGQVNE